MNKRRLVIFNGFWDHCEGGTEIEINANPIPDQKTIVVYLSFLVALIAINHLNSFFSLINSQSPKYSIYSCFLNLYVVQIGKFQFLTSVNPFHYQTALFWTNKQVFLACKMHKRREIVEDQWLGTEQFSKSDVVHPGRANTENL